MTRRSFGRFQADISFTIQAIFADSSSSQSVMTGCNHPIQRRFLSVNFLDLRLPSFYTHFQKKILEQSAMRFLVGQLCKKSLGLFIGLALLIPGISFGAQVKKAPVPVTVGIYVTDVYDVDLKKGSYTADFYLWFKWRGDVNPRRFEIVNGYIAAKSIDSHTTVNGFHHISYRCRAVMHGQFNLSDYPWDKQVMPIIIEDDDSDVNSLIYVADVEDSRTSSGMKVADRMVSSFKIYVHDNVYNTTFGNPARAADERSTYSRFVAELTVVHAGIRGFVKTFLSLFIAVAIAFLTFIIPPGDLPPRFSMGLTGLFGAVSSQIVLYQLLDECPYLTVADKIHYVALFFIFLSILESAIALRLFHSGKELLWKRMDQCSIVAFPLLFIISVILLVAFR
jgi:hypothetical protein